MSLVFTKQLGAFGALTDTSRSYYKKPNFMDGEVAERLKAAASKAVEVIFASVSSNLTLSARKINKLIFTCGWWLLAGGLMFSRDADG